MPLLRRLRHQVAKSPVRAPLVWIRHQSLRSSDVFFASYPRSASTWLRFLLYDSLLGESSGFSSVNQAIPDVKLHKAGVQLIPCGGRLIEPHEYYNTDDGK